MVELFDCTCTPPTIPGCALVEGRVLTHDSLPAANIAVWVEPVGADNIFNVSTSRTDSVGRFQDKVLLFPGSPLPDSAEARIVALRIPPPSQSIPQPIRLTRFYRSPLTASGRLRSRCGYDFRLRQARNRGQKQRKLRPPPKQPLG